MHRGPFPTPITLADDERMKLNDWCRRPTTAQRLALRAHIVLAAADGRSNTAIATDLHVTLPTVRKWRDRPHRPQVARPLRRRATGGADR
jgi:hypothetical protein